MNLPTLAMIKREEERKLALVGVMPAFNTTTIYARPLLKIAKKMVMYSTVFSFRPLMAV